MHNSWTFSYQHDAYPTSVWKVDEKKENFKLKICIHSQNTHNGKEKKYEMGLEKNVLSSFYAKKDTFILIRSVVSLDFLPP